MFCCVRALLLVSLFICAFSLFPSTFRFSLPPFARFSGDPNYGMFDMWCRSEGDLVSRTRFRFMGDFVPNLYKTGTIKWCESRSSRVDQEVTRICFFTQELKPCELTRDAKFAGIYRSPSFALSYYSYPYVCEDIYDSPKYKGGRVCLTSHTHFFVSLLQSHRVSFQVYLSLIQV